MLQKIQIYAFVLKSAPGFNDPNPALNAICVRVLSILVRTDREHNFNWLACACAQHQSRTIVTIIAGETPPNCAVRMRIGNNRIGSTQIDGPDRDLLLSPH